MSSFSQIISTLDIYDNSLKFLSYAPEAPRSAVAIIVKQLKRKQQNHHEFSFEHDQILFLQRKKSQRDKFSGQICLPGGKQQKHQILLQTVIRQTYQQTNIKLQQRHLIGCVNNKINLILSIKKQSNNQNHTYQNAGSNKNKKQMVVYCFVFLIYSEEIQSQTIMLNKDQMSSYKWVPTYQLMNTGNICWFDYSSRIQGVIKYQNLSQSSKQQKNSINSIFSSVSRVLSPAIDIGMNEKLYGITLYIILIILSNLQQKLQAILYNLSTQNQKCNKKDIKSLICSVKEIRQRCQSHVILEINKPIDQNFINFQKTLLQGIYSLRPKL